MDCPRKFRLTRPNRFVREHGSLKTLSDFPIVIIYIYVPFVVVRDMTRLVLVGLVCRFIYIIWNTGFVLRISQNLCQLEFMFIFCKFINFLFKYSSLFVFAPSTITAYFINYLQLHHFLPFLTYYVENCRRYKKKLKLKTEH